MTKKPALPEIVSAIAAAVGTEIGNEESRKQFAESVLSHVAHAIPKGGQRDRKARALREVADTAERAREAIDQLRNLTVSRVENDLVFRVDTQQALSNAGMSWIEHSKGFQSVDDILSEASRYASELVRNSRPIANARKKTGPNITDALEVATSIARAYFFHFRRAPGYSKAGKREGRSGTIKVQTTPFDRVCDVVEQLLQRRTPPISISGVARARAVKALKPSSR